MELPFVKVIRTEKNTYVYDVNSGNIVRVSPIIGEILENWGHVPKQLYSRRNDYRKAIQFVKKVQSSQRLFLPDRPLEIRPNLIPENFENKTEKDLGLCSHIILNITEQCNFRCRYCIYSGLYHGRRTHSNKTMSWDIARKAIDILVKSAQQLNEPIFLGFYGGEPLLHFDFIKRAVHYAKQQLGSHQHHFSITTNGTLLSDAVLKFLIENRFIITISIDGPEEIHNKNRRFKNGKGTFKQVIKRIAALRLRMGDDHFRNYVNISGVLTPPYDFELLYKFFANFPTTVRVSTLEYLTDFYENRKTHRAKGWEMLAKAVKNHCLIQNRNADFRSAGLSLPYEIFNRELKRIHRRDLDKPLGHTTSVLGLCQPGNARAFISTEGNIYVCERVESHNNMLIGTVELGIDGNRVKRILNDISKLDFSHCRDCWIVRMCRLCFAHIVDKDQYSLEKWQFSCENSRELYEFTLKLYCEIMEEDEKALDFLSPIQA